MLLIELHVEKFNKDATTSISTTAPTIKENIPIADFGPGWGDEPNPDMQRKRIFMAEHDTSVVLQSSGKQAISMSEYKEREAKRRNEGIVDKPITVDIITVDEIWP